MRVTNGREDAMGTAVHSLGEEGLLGACGFRLGAVLQLIQVF